jgi:hypothetical protein
MFKKLEQRFVFISTLLFWEGQINAKNLMVKFNITRQSASALLKKYRDLHSNAVTYNSSNKAYVITSEFDQTYLNTIECSLTDYVKLTESSLVNSIDAYNVSAYEVEVPLRNIRPLQVRPILRAIREKKAIDIGYISLSSPDYSDRIIEPHSLIFDGLRWHVRAYCCKNLEFRDFSLSRFNGKAEFEGNATHSVEQDIKWQNYIDLEIEPDQRFSNKQKQVIINDYQMQGGTKIIRTRIAMLNYLIKRLHLDNYQATPQAQQIVITCQCREAIKQYLFI